MTPDGNRSYYARSDSPRHIWSHLRLTGPGRKISPRIFLAVLAATAIGIASCDAGPAGPEPALRAVDLDGAASNQSLLVDGPSLHFPSAEWFVAPTVANLTFAAKSSSEGVALAIVAGSTVSVKPVAAGTAEVTVTARSSAGLSASVSFGVTVVHSTADDRTALAALYDSTGGASWTNNTNWKTAEPLGKWHGVTTDSTGRVTSIDLGSNGLKGAIPPQLGDLSKLWNLRLGSNSLTDSIPSELGNLSVLTDLYLDENDLTGSIPSKLGDLSSLRNLWLSGNDLTGSIPKELGNLSSLSTLFLYENDLTGSIPAELGQLSGLRGLRLSGNRLTDSIPAALGDLTSLTDLFLDDNRLTGSVPPDLGNLTRLTSLWLNDNAGLNGPLPVELADTMTLDSFHYSDTGLCVPADNDFETWLDAIEDHDGTIGCERAALEALYNATGGANWKYSTNWMDDTLSLGQWFGVVTDSTTGRVSQLHLPYNRLAGELPKELGNLDSLERLRLQVNGLTGKVPKELGQLTKLRLLHLGTNSLTGEIPKELGNLPHLWFLRLNRNRLTGEIPKELGQLANLEELGMLQNRLTGQIPAEFGDLAKLKYLYLFDNGLTGEIPEELGGLDSLKHLRLDDNGLTGKVPKELGELSKLTKLRLNDNAGLNGPLPVELADTMTLDSFHYSDTGLCVPADNDFETWLDAIEDHDGTIGCERAALEALYNATGGANWKYNTNWMDDTLSLGQWFGVVTDSTTGRVSQLHLPYNRLAGELPKELANLDSLETLRLQVNGLTGKVPKELGQLTKLRFLHLGTNSLTGEIPKELGNLPHLWFLRLNRNRLTGEIPKELGQLANLEELGMLQNRLTGQIPAEFGDLAKLKYLYLFDNGLTGEIPEELGGLDSLKHLRLDDNGLTGKVPKELGELSKLTKLRLNDNAGLNGPLPVELADTMTLDSFHYADTGLCVPDNASFRSWLAGISDHIGTGVVCSSSSSGDAAAPEVLNTLDSALLTSPRRRPRPRS